MPSRLCPGSPGSGHQRPEVLGPGHGSNEIPPRYTGSGPEVVSASRLLFQIIIKESLLSK